MSRSEYRYRFIHALAEKLLSVMAPFVGQTKGLSLNEPPQKILVLKFGGMGEAVLARSLVAGLCNRNPFMHFDYLVEGRTVEVMCCGSEARVLRYDSHADSMNRALAILREVRSRQYDAVIDFEQRSLLTAAFTWATSIPVRVGFTPATASPRGRMFTHTVDLRERESMWGAFVRLGRVLDPGLPETLSAAPLPYSADSRAWLDEWWHMHGIANLYGPVVAMHLGVGPSAEYRRWPIERFATLATMLAAMQKDLTIVLTGANAEQSLMSEFRQRFAGRCIDAFDLGGIEHTAALLHHCDLLVSSDTGIMHLAAAMGTPTVGLFGPNTPVCWAPVGPRATFVYSTHMPCSPCINSYRRQIPEKCVAYRESACMWDITCDDVLNAARSVASGSWLNDDANRLPASATENRHEHLTE